MANSIEFAKNYTGILDEVYQRASMSPSPTAESGCTAGESPMQRPS